MPAACAASSPAGTLRLGARPQDGTSRRVVVTGMGLVSPLGHEVDAFYSHLLEGRSGVSEISSFDASGFSTRFAGEIKVRARVLLRGVVLLASCAAALRLLLHPATHSCRVAAPTCCGTRAVRAGAGD